METPSATGAAAAATYFIELYGYTWATGDTGRWSEISADSCDFCTTVASNVQESAAAGFDDSGSPIEVIDAVGTEIEPGMWYSADLRVHQGPSTRTGAAGEVVSESAGGDFSMAVELSWTGSWWQVDAADIIADDGSVS